MDYPEFTGRSRRRLRGKIVDGPPEWFGRMIGELLAGWNRATDDQDLSGRNLKKVEAGAKSMHAGDLKWLDPATTVVRAADHYEIR